MIRGHRYFHGAFGYTQDFVLLVQHFERAAHNEEAEGMYNLALKHIVLNNKRSRHYSRN